MTESPDMAASGRAHSAAEGAVTKAEMQAIRDLEPSLPKVTRETIEAILPLLNGRDGGWSWWGAEELAKTVLAAERFAKAKSAHQCPVDPRD